MRFTISHRHLVASLLLMGSCARPGPPEEAKTAPTVAEADATDQTVQSAQRNEAPTPATAQSWSDRDALVGVVHRGGTKACLPGQTDQPGKWYGIHPVIGFVPVHTTAEAGTQLEAFRGQPVVAWGAPAERGPVATDLPDNAESCMVQFQKRSDWVESPDGIRVPRGGPPPISAFRVAHAERFDGLSLTRSNGKLLAKLHNSFKVALKDVQLVMHYEGCYGKPGTTAHEAPTREVLEPGEDMQATFDEVVTGPPRRRFQKQSQYLAADVRVEAKGKQLYFDLTASVSELGVETSCPETSQPGAKTPAPEGPAEE